MKRFSVFGLLALIVTTSSAAANLEVWNLPAKGLLQMEVAKSVPGSGELQVLANGKPLAAQEISGSDCCVVNPGAELRLLSRKEPVKVEFRRKQGPTGTGVRTPTLKVSNSAFSLEFDETKNGGLPSSVIWSTGKRVDGIGWGDRVYSHGMVGGNIARCRNAEVWDFGTGSIFRHVRTIAWFENAKGRCEGEPKAVYDWLFLNDNPEWVVVRMRFSGRQGVCWQQLHSGQLEFPFSAFTDSAVAVADGTVASRKLPRNGKSDRPASKIMAALFGGREFAAVAGHSVCVYTDPTRKIDYLHSSDVTAYNTDWDGGALTRVALFRFGSADDVCETLKGQPPINGGYGFRKFVDAAKVKEASLGEKVSKICSGGLEVAIVDDGKRAAIKGVLANGEVLAIGPQRLFSASLENVESARKMEISSLDEWSSVTSWRKEGGVAGWRFSGLKAKPGMDLLSVEVQATPTKDGGIDWSFSGQTGSSDYAIAEVSVGELSILCSGMGMRAVWPGCMGEKVFIPCADNVRFNGSYPSMNCVMPWQAVWDENNGRCFMLAALDSEGGSKYVRMHGRSSDATVSLSVRHQLAWDVQNPGAIGKIDGVVAWREFGGDWYDAALYYRDWVRENAVWYPKMGKNGRVSTPDWFKDLGYILKTYGSAKTMKADVKLCRELLGVPIMVHWYDWFPSGFDNDYPHYYPPNPDVKEGVKWLHAEGFRAVPYTNGHIWDTHDRGAEDWHFSRYGAYGACRRKDGSIATETYRSVETNGEKVVFAAMCPASKVWHDKVVENGGHVVNDCDFDGYYMDQIGAFSHCMCYNPEHGHPFGVGNWWQNAYRRMLKDVRAKCKKPVFLATEGNAESNFGQIDACVCWHIPGGIDTVPAFEVCYSGAVTVYCRAPMDPWSREMRMKLANTLVDGDMFGWMPVLYCKVKGFGDYLRTCVRFRHKNVEWFNKGEMRRPPRLLDAVSEWNETWSDFVHKRPVRMPIVQTAARRILDYDYDKNGNRLWKTGRVRKAVVYFTNFSPDETAKSRVQFDANDLGIDLNRVSIMRVNAEGARTPFLKEDLDRPFEFEPSSCFGIEFEVQ